MEYVTVWQPEEVVRAGRLCLCSRVRPWRGEAIFYSPGTKLTPLSTAKPSPHYNA
ncbi:hypothetical protein PN471_00540 [Aphanizomenon sp. CS-733/32]|uniref:hypothetical protein n=1 Tax=Aphanizomenon sp. CS-733/32 TaxID=3021715 RepID=UPI00232EE725|nr:hypothetical protein [Aphanizomenon sp. CS-733/32]MDB9307172.1 hypothetical protein [Aphanizomenon sp. CS-733/32]